MYDLISVMKIAKSMKRPIVYITPNYMLGTDEEFCTLSVIEISSEIPRSFAVYTNNVLEGTKKEKYAIDHPDIFFSEYELFDKENDFYINTWNEEVIKNNILSLFQKVHQSLSSPFTSKVYSEEGLETNEQFISTVAKLKINDGMTTYFIDNKYMITSFNKVHAINATDKINVIIYDVDPVSYLYEFSINKKKYIVKEYIRYRKM